MLSLKCRPYIFFFNSRPYLTYDRFQKHRCFPLLTKYVFISRSQWIQKLVWNTTLAGKLNSSAVSHNATACGPACTSRMTVDAFARILMKGNPKQYFFKITMY